MTTIENLRAAVPQHTLAALDRYVNHNIEPGGFLRAVLENNLSEALGRADHINREALFAIVSYVYNDCPADCWGTPAKVAQWLAELEKE